MQNRSAVWAASSFVALAASCGSASPNVLAITSEMRRTSGDAIVLEYGSPDVTRVSERVAELERATRGRAIVEPFHVHEIELAGHVGRPEILQGAGPHTLDRLARHVVEGTLDAVRAAPVAGAPIAIAMSRAHAGDLGLDVGSTIAITASGPHASCASRTARIDALVVMPTDDVFPDSARTLFTSNAAAHEATCAGPAALRIMSRDPRHADAVVATIERHASADGLRVVPFRELHAGLIRALESRE